jgi:hypothetical protein
LPRDGSSGTSSSAQNDARPGRGHRADGDQRFRVLDVVIFEERDWSPFVGLLQLEAAY